MSVRVYKVFVETRCICDHSTEVAIPEAEFEGLSEAEAEAIVKDYAETAFWEVCNYGWSSEYETRAN